MDFNEIKRIIKPWVFLVAFGILFSAIIFNLSTTLGLVFQVISLFKPLFYGIAIAYVLNIPMKSLEKMIQKHTKENSFLQKKSRAFAIFLTLILALLALAILVSIILPKLASSFGLLLNNFNTYLTSSVEYINKLLNYFNIDYDASKSQIYQYLENLKWNDIIKNAASWLSSGASSIISTSMGFIGSFGTWFTAFMLSLYLLTAKEDYLTQLRKIIAALFKEKQTEYIFKVGTKANAIFSGFIGGQLVEAVILGVLCYIGMLIFRFPFSELISVIVAITSLVPMFGAMFGMAFGCILIFALNPIQSIWFIVYFQCLQQFEGNVIYPRVVGGSVGISGIYVLLSLVIFGGLFGITGMLIAVPMTALLYSTISEWINHRLDQKKLFVDDKNFYSTKETKKE